MPQRIADSRDARGTAESPCSGARARISLVRNALATHSGDFAAITPMAKAKWTKVLDYNWHDCNGLREVMLRVFSAG
jgi:hypothetical protein